MGKFSKLYFSKGFFFSKKNRPSESKKKRSSVGTNGSRKNVPSHILHLRKSMSSIFLLKGKMWGSPIWVCIWTRGFGHFFFRKPLFYCELFSEDLLLMFLQLYFSKIFGACKRGKKILKMTPWSFFTQGTPHQNRWGENFFPLMGGYPPHQIHEGEKFPPSIS